MPATAPQVEALATYCHAPANDPYVKQCADEAADAVAFKLSQSPNVTVPESAQQRAILEYGKEQFDRRASRNGVVGLDSPDFAPMRVGRDPWKAAWPHIAQYFGPAIG